MNSLQELPNIKLKVLRRKSLRALASQPIGIKWPFSRMETRTVADGTDTYKDSDGKSHTKTHYSTISINMYYTIGNVELSVNTPLSHSAGFDCTLVYRDGYGEARKPRTGEMHHEVNQKAIMDLTHMGFIDLTSFEVDTRFELFMKSARDLINIDSILTELKEVDNSYRSSLVEKFSHDDDV